MLGLTPLHETSVSCWCNFCSRSSVAEPGMFDKTCYRLEKNYQTSLTWLFIIWLFMNMIVITKNIIADSALRCNMCESEKSWNHCQENGIIVDCSRRESGFDVCFKVHIARKMSDDSEKHLYKRGCGFQELCSGEQCIKYGDRCLVNCCNTDNCNASLAAKASIYLTYSLVGISIAFQLC